MTRPRPFDEPYAREVVAAVRGLAPDAVPRWGSMSGRDLLPHLLAALRYSLGLVPFDVPPQVRPWRQALLRWLFLDVGVRMPRNVRFRDVGGEVVPLAKVSGGIDDLRAALLLVARARDPGAPAPPPHPYLGTLTLTQWKQLHARHIDHHLRQFGMPPIA